MKLTKWLIGLGLICSLSLFSCSKNQKPQQETIVYPDGREVVAVFDETITPSTETRNSSFTGQGVSYTRQVDAVRVLSPFGVSSGEVISKQEPSKIGVSETPGINISPEGVGVTKGKVGEFTGGGSHFTWWDNLKVLFNDWFWTLIIIGIGIAVIFGLSFIPGTVGTVFKGIWNWIKGIITGGISAVTNWWKNRKLTTTIDQTVKGGDNFKNKIEKLTIDEQGYLKEVKPQDIIDMFNDEQQKAQDISSKELVKQFRIR